MHNQPHTFVALYTGSTIGQARIIAASSDPELVGMAASKMLQEQENQQEGNSVFDSVNEGRGAALQIIQGGATSE